SSRIGSKMDDEEFSLDTSDLDGIYFSALSQDPPAQEDAPEVTPEPQEEVAEGGINPAWQPFLKDVPESLHRLVTPAFAAWDKSVQNRFSEVNKKYEPWKAFAEQNLEPTYIEQA